MSDLATRLKHDAEQALDTSRKQVRGLEAENARLRAELAAATEHEEALDAKLGSLTPHGTCGCSYDKAGDLCLHHSPLLAKASAELETAHQAGWANAQRLLAATNRAEQAEAREAGLRDICDEACEDLLASLTEFSPPIITDVARRLRAKAKSG